VPVLPYEEPEGRPSSLLILHGGGNQGHGESVAWTMAAQDAFVERVAVLKGRGTVASLACEFVGYTRMAVEGALIDLALRQNHMTLEQLAGPGQPVRFAISFDRCADPVERAKSMLAGNPDAVFKIDVDPRWGDVRELARLNCVAVLDFKGEGTLEQGKVLRELFPDAIFEDGPAVPGAASADQGIDTPGDVADVTADWVNIKAGRMGGFLAALYGLEEARLRSIGAYFGGQFELGPGRNQARRLAALYTAGGTNDLAPIPPREDAARGPSPLAIDLNEGGFR